MNALLSVSRRIDAVNAAIGRLVALLVVLAVMISAGNALSRKLLSLSSNAWLELQWYLFGAVFMLGAAWTLARDEHVRVDVLFSRLSPRMRDRINLFGHCVFLAPFALIHVAFAWPFFLSSLRSGEVSASAGGLILWPAKALVVLGFALLSAQALSEIVKTLARLRDEGAPPPEDAGPR